jgi:hypothetical protein
MQVIELQYLPQPAYIAQFLVHSNLVIDGYEHYVKQTYRNRCRILGANGVDQLSVPVIASGKKIPTRDIKIDHAQKWLNRHWRAIQSAYGRAPYFEFYRDDYEAIFQKKHTFLFDFTLELLTQCLDHLQFDIAIECSSEYVEHPEIDLRKTIKPKMTHNERILYRQLPYQQVFGSNFVEQLSVIDLIFSEGPGAGDLLKAGIISGT